ncbi:beta-1,3-glucan-binding protein-like isoform X2 [Littorina saxatilis]|uniref:GH16 domain-containing protein n=3 Tax=Littorina saxatilis TaxID=31220 RepID=A0AAN9C0L3_9CAEN
MLAVWCALMLGVPLVSGVGPVRFFNTQRHGIHVDIAGGPPSPAYTPPTPVQAGRKTVTVFYDDFSSGRIDPSKWNVAATADGGGGEEFNMYTPEPVNSYVRNGTLFIRPTYTVDTFGKDFLRNGTLNVTAKWGRCTDQQRNGCYRKGWNSIPPVMSAFLASRVHIRYGKVEVVAKLPRGDWLWPAIWMLPTESYYGAWPRSGEIDIMESRGNSQYHTPEGWSVGNNAEFDTIHYGPAWNDRKSYGCSHTLKGQSFADRFHLYWFDWTEDYMRMGVDNLTVLSMPTPQGGFWKEGHFEGPDIWAKGGKNAPFDRPFYLILNVAVGGRFFKESYKNAPYPQPWADNAPDKKMQFWLNRTLWENTWRGDNSAMQIKSVKMMQYLD